ncbi:MAG: hypothetical protein ACFB0G_12630 [Leptolyngbyaceae cyanobacterium]
MASFKKGFSLSSNQVLNIFPAIDKLYRSTEGKVGEVSFKTDGGSTKNEKMRRTHEDLRQEIYHHAGRKALEDAESDIRLYKIAILLEYQLAENIQSKPELFLPGRKVQLSKITPELEEFLISKCCGLEDYEFVFKKIVSYSTNRGE